MHFATCQDIISVCETKNVAFKYKKGYNHIGNKGEIMINNYFGKNLKYLRNKKGYDQKKLGEILHVGRSTISCWESGARIPRIETIMAIANYFHVDQDIISTDLRKKIPANEYDQMLKTIAIKNGIKITIQKDKPLTRETIRAINEILYKEMDDQEK